MPMQFGVGGYGSVNMYGQTQASAPYQDPSAWMSRPSGVYDAMSAAYFQGMPQQTPASFDPRSNVATYANSYGYYGMDMPRQPSGSGFGYQNSFTALPQQQYVSSAAGQLNQPPVYSPQRMQQQRQPQQQYVPPSQLFPSPQPSRGALITSEGLGSGGGGQSKARLM